MYLYIHTFICGKCVISESMKVYMCTCVISDSMKAYVCTCVISDSMKVGLYVYNIRISDSMNGYAIIPQ